jgi:glycosyltransferase involved in cell wall biosynthesis
MACGVPVLTSNNSSIPEVVQDAGVLVDPQDSGAIASGLTRLLQDDSLRAGLSVRGRQRAAKLNWDQTAEQTLTVLEREAAA